jgi:PAS domain S-box-containing protein
MCRCFPTTIRFRLILLILLATVPMLALTLYTGMEERRLAASTAKSEAMRMVRIASGDYERLVQETHVLLESLTHRPEIKNGDVDGSKAAFVELMKRYPQYNDIGLANADGDLFCTVQPFLNPVNLADRAWFKRVVEKAGFVISDYLTSRVTGKPCIVFASPVTNNAGHFNAVLFVSLDLTWLNGLVAKFQLPEGAAVALRDGSGTYLARYPDSRDWVGKTMPQAPIFREIRATSGEGTSENYGQDGIKRLYAFSPLLSDPEMGLNLSIGIPGEVAYGDADRIFRRNLIGLFLVTVMAALVTWLGTDRFVLRQLNLVVNATKRLSGGDLSARIGLPANHGELFQLANAFDEMATSMEQLTGELTQAEAQHRSLVEQVPAIIYLASLTGDSRTLYISPQVQAILGYPQEEWTRTPELWLQLLHPEDRECVLAQIERTRLEAEPFCSDYRLRNRDGQMVWIRDEAVVVRDESGNSLYLQGIMRDVSERRQAQQALQESEAKFRNLIAALPIAVFIHDGGRFRYVNSAAQDLTGFSKDELIDMHFWEPIHPDYRRLIKEQDLPIEKSNTPFHSEIIMLTKDGEEVWVDFSSVLLNCQGKSIVLFAVSDITMRKHNEDRIKNLSRHNQLILNAVTEGIFGLDMQGRVTFINPAAAQLSGWNAEELIGQSMHAILHHTKANGTPYSHADCPNYRTLLQGTCHHVDCEVFWKRNGTCFPVEYSSTPLKDEDGAVLGAVVTFKDITERMRTEAERSRLATAIEQSAESVVITSPEGIIQYVNPAFELITGYSRSEIVGRHPRLLKSGKHDRSFYNSIRVTVNQGEVWHGRLTSKKKSGMLFETETSISPVRDNSGFVINHVAVQRDVTVEAQLESQLRQSQKMQAIGTLAGGIAHDFNNILMAIMGYSEIAISKAAPGSPVCHDLEQVLRASFRAKELVKQILTFSRRSEQERKPVELRPVVKEALKLLRASLPATIQMHLDLAVAPGQDLILADPTQIHQVIMNLCTNAGYAMRERGGRLSVSLVSEDRGSDFVVQQTDLRPGHHMHLTISDTGTGMDQIVLERLFEPFFTTKNPGEGTGMGLAVVHGIVKAHGGAITVHSELDKGTAFHILFPRIESLAALRPDVKVSALLPCGNERILLVDDEETILEVGKKRLERIGYQVVAKASGVEALQTFVQQADRFDLVITDQTMPHLTGAELAIELQRIRPDIPIILCTGFSEAMTPERAKAIGIRELLMKPVAMHDLASSIRAALGKRSA